ncbi:MAG: hypothetical protein A2070_10575 [Bdellovibrionales bacterium GWC1_52_8]|nr:MAG: hypothetical protein A2070_10575 [Bdellovibrionales bacterium GWC1_52_8]
MNTNKNRLKILISAAGISAAVLLSTALPLRSQEPATGNEAAVSNVVNQHIHSVALRTEDLTELISLLTSDIDSVTLESSTGYDQGFRNGIPHTHAIELRRPQLLELLNTGRLTVESGIALNHTHLFRFLEKAQCPIMASPIPSLSPSPSPSPSPTPTATPSPTLSPTPEPTVTPGPTFTILS